MSDLVLLAIAGYVAMAVWSHDLIRDYGYFGISRGTGSSLVDVVCAATWPVQLPVAGYNFLVMEVYDWIEEDE